MADKHAFPTFTISNSKVPRMKGKYFNMKKIKEKVWKLVIYKK